MENAPRPFENLTPGSTASSLEKKLFICKITSLSACIISTVVNINGFEPYYGLKYFGILMPAITSGYIIITIAEIIALSMKQEHIFLELCFAIIGSIGSAICGIYQMWKWIPWITDVYSYGGSDYGVPEFVQATACLLHATCLAIVVFLRKYKKPEVSHNNQ